MMDYEHKMEMIRQCYHSHAGNANSRAMPVYWCNKNKATCVLHKRDNCTLYQQFTTGLQRPGKGR